MMMEELLPNDTKCPYTVILLEAQDVKVVNEKVSKTVQKLRTNKAGNSL
jgi:hypothetical protein